MTQTQTPTEIETRTLEVPGASIVYDVRRNGVSTTTPLMLIGYPMSAPGFASLASHFADRTVITYDPRGSERSTKHADEPVTTPDLSAEDVHRVIEAVGGPVDLFGSSGGATTTLALVAKHPEAVHVAVAHEPPLGSVLPDKAEIEAAVKDIHDTYMSGGFGLAMGKFIAIVSHQGAIPGDFASRPAPDPAMFGLPTEDDGSREDPLFSPLVELVSYEPDFDALRAASTRIVLAAGEESEGIIAARGAEAVAERLGTKVEVFPGGHNGFLGGEYGQMGKPDEFAMKLREVLDS